VAGEVAGVTGWGQVLQSHIFEGKAELLALAFLTTMIYTMIYIVLMRGVSKIGGVYENSKTIL
jgi:hypothetical protein